MRRSLLVVLAPGLLLAADKKEDAVKADKDKLQGTWAVVAMEVDGEKAPEQEVKALKLVITADKITVKQGDKGRDAAYAIDPAKKPKAIDLTPAEGVSKDKAQPGIYELDGDNLKICFTTAGQERPREFAAKGGSGVFLVVLKREKP